MKARLISLSSDVKLAVLLNNFYLKRLMEGSID